MNLEERYKIGKEIFNEIFKLKGDELRDMVRDIIGDFDTDVVYKGAITKKTVNEEPESILFCYYDSIEINYLGVYFNPESGSKSCLRAFDNHFKL